MRMLLVAAACAALVSTPALAQSGAMPHHDGHGPAPTTGDPAAAALAEINARMHAEMDIPPSGKPDIDFARGMIPHHQGAIDMAKLVLEYGQDAELRVLAEQIIAAQEQEIAFLQDWLRRNAP